MISVVVPIYGVDKFLPKCIDSILSQTYTDLRILLIDDGSPDASPAICDAYKEKDSRITVIHKKNAGVSAARNTGIDLAEGEYITFVDGDDYLAENMLEDLHNALKKDGADLATITTAVIVAEEGFEPPLFTSRKPLRLTGLHPALEVGRAFLEEEPLLASVVWGKLYKRELFSSLRFDTEHPYEDTRILPYIYTSAKTCVCVDGDYYYYLQRASSAMHQESSPKRLVEFIDSRIHKIRVFYNNGLRDASYDKERTLLESRLLWAKYLSKGNEAAERSLAARKRWFDAQKWYVRGSRTKLELLQEELQEGSI
ncbi:MAG: glycosyltransferase [Clostridiales bacterium]|jgi:glycosyltransferase involved in cell wall biosynthesis|nr:glycosyltransferase [Clostridiales bacterium]